MAARELERGFGTGARVADRWGGLLGALHDGIVRYKQINLAKWRAENKGGGDTVGHPQAGRAGDMHQSVRRARQGAQKEGREL